MARARRHSYVDHPPEPPRDGDGAFTRMQGEDAVYVLAGLFQQEGLLGPVIRMALYDIENNLRTLKCNRVHAKCPIHASNHDTPCPS